jgi:hypothetical protein
VTDGVPGDLRPDADRAQLLAEIEKLHTKVSLLSAEPPSSVLDAAPRGGSVAFVAMPFEPEPLQVVYEDFLRPAIEDACGAKCFRGDDALGSSVVMEDILAGIKDADIVVADLTGQNANVFYEIGIAHAFEKKVLLISQSSDDVPFDLRHRRILVYDYTPRGCKTLEGAVARHVLEMLSDT